MKKYFLVLPLFVLAFLLPNTTLAVGETCSGTPASSSCCTEPQAIIDGGGCPSGQVWIGDVISGSCQTPVVCTTETRFSCSNNTCYTPTSYSCSNARDVNIGTADCCANGQVAVFDSADPNKWVCGDAGGGKWDDADYGGGIMYNGNVGINNNSAQNALDVEGAIVVGAPYAGSNTGPTDGLGIYGDVGIGTTVPANRLQIHEPANVAAYVQVTNQASGSTSGDGVLIGVSPSRDMLLLNQESADVYIGPPGGFLMIESSGDVGIGTADPSEKLDVDGDIQSSVAFMGVGGHGSNYAHFSHVNYKGSGQYALLQHGTAGHTYLNSVGTGNLYFRNDNDTQMIITDTGDVGIGQDNPSYDLDVYDDIRATDDVFVNDDLNVDGDADIDLDLNVDGSATIDGGINTTGVLQLDVTDANADVGYVVRFQNDGATEFGLKTNGGVVIGSNTTGPAEGLYVNGSVGIGDSSPSYKLDVSGDIRATGDLRAGDDLFVSDRSYFYDNVYSEADQDGGSTFIFQNLSGDHDADVLSAYIHDSRAPDGGEANCFYKMFDGDYSGSSNRVGSICADSGSSVEFYTTSDQRLKTNIVDLSNGLDLVMKMKPRVFEWKSELGISQMGFIAQELYEVMPRAVIGNPDSDVNENPMSVTYAKLTPVLTAAIQDQQKIIEGLEARIAELENK
ncbi:tail fiber domain-containing protein, partial [Patescibacteria group bacterium]|nr:tail fiber domain-containing protein [Patescibacteria group bacterium]